MPCVLDVYLPGGDETGPAFTTTCVLCTETYIGQLWLPVSAGPYRCWFSPHRSLQRSVLATGLLPANPFIFPQTVGEGRYVLPLFSSVHTVSVWLQVVSVDVTTDHGLVAVCSISNLSHIITLVIL